MYIYTHHTRSPQGDMGAVWQMCWLITAKELIKEICDPSWLSWVVKAMGSDKYYRGEKLLDEAQCVSFWLLRTHSE